MSNSATPSTAARQASLSITNSRSPPKPTSIELVMPSNHLILCHPLLLLPSIFLSIRVFSNESALRIRWRKYWSFSFNISPSNGHPGLISFRMDWLDLLAVQGTLKSEFSNTTVQKHQFFGAQFSFGEGNGTPFQYSHLENLMDGGARWAAVHGVTKSRTRLSDFTFTFSLSCILGNGKPLQCSCLENPRDGGAWWAAIYGVAQSQTRLKWLSSSSSFLYSPPSHPYMTTGKTIALTRRTFVDKVMSLLFNMLSRLVIGEGNGNPLQYSCLENPMDGGAW